MFKNQIKKINRTEGFSTVQYVLSHAYINDMVLNEFYFSRYSRRRNYETVQLESMIFFSGDSIFSSLLKSRMLS